MSDKILKIIESPKFYGPIIIILVSILLYNIISYILNNAVIKGKTDIERKRRTTLILLFNNIMKYIIVIIAALMILNIYGINTTSILAGLGIVGVVIGLALQDALKDIIGGINIIMDNYYVVGDLVKCKDFTGTVIAFGLKTTKIEALNGDILTIANRNIDSIINLSEKKSTIIIKVPTAYEEDHKKVKKVLNGIIEKVSKYDFVDASGCAYLGIEDLDFSSINYSFKIKCKQGKEFDLRREILELVKEAYEKNNIKIPYDQLEVHHGSDI